MMKWVGRLGGFVTLGLGLVLATPGCDGEVATTGDNSETQGEPAGASGAAVTAGTSSAGGSGAVDAGGTGAPGCLGAPDPAPELKVNSELDADVVSRAGVVFGSCWPDDGVERSTAQLWNQSISGIRWQLVTQASCLANATCGCDAVSHCLGFEVQTGVDPSCQSSCEDGVFIACGEGVDLEPGYAIRMDCKKLGQDCDPIAGCSSGPATACSGTTQNACRAGERPLYCDDEALREGPDCEALGLGCAAGFCQGTGASCVSTHPGVVAQGVVDYEGTSCTGGVLEACVNGKLANVTCSERGPGFGCQSVNGVPFCGLASECLPGDGFSSSKTNPPQCDGNVLTFCNAGRLERVDCTSLGFTGCNVDGHDGHYGCTPSLSL